MSETPVIAIDTETFWSKKLKYTVRTMLPEHYAAHHLFDCFCVSASDGKTAWAGHPRDFNWDALNGKILISHHARHDQAVIYEMVKRGQIPSFTPAAWYCSASMTTYLFGRRALADAVDYCYKTRLAKEVRDSSAEKHWPADYSADEQAKMLEYARADAHWTWRLWNDYSPQWPQHERELANWHIQRGREGVQIDKALLNNYIIQTHACKLKTQSVLPWLQDQWDEEDEFSAKPTSTKCIAEECRRCGIPAPPVKSREGEEAFQEWEAQYGPAHPWISALSSWRSVNKLLKTFERMKERIGIDGRMPFGQKYCGTDTGRVSGDGQVNLFNQRKQAVLIDERGLMETDDIRVNDAHKDKKKTGAWPAWVQHAIDIRNLIIAPPGTQLVTSDLSQIEPRCSAYIVKDNDFLDLVRAGHSPYAAHAIATMNWDPSRDIKAEGGKTYDLAKMRTLSLGYGASWRKLIIMARANAGIDLTVGDPEEIEERHPRTGELRKVSGYGAQAKAVVRDYRAQNVKIVSTWKMLDQALRSSVGGDFSITLPSGRKLRFEKIRADTRLEADEDGQPYRKIVFTAEVDGTRKIVYGSKLFAMTIQSFARDIAYDATMRLEAMGICVRLMVYDEVVVELRPDQRVEDVTRVMMTPPSWLPGFPLATDTKVLTCYTK